MLAAGSRPGAGWLAGLQRQRKIAQRRGHGSPGLGQRSAASCSRAHPHSHTHRGTLSLPTPPGGAGTHSENSMTRGVEAFSTHALSAASLSLPSNTGCRGKGRVSGIGGEESVDQEGWRDGEGGRQPTARATASLALGISHASRIHARTQHTLHSPLHTHAPPTHLSTHHAHLLILPLLDHTHKALLGLGALEGISQVRLLGHPAKRHICEGEGVQAWMGVRAWVGGSVGGAGGRCSVGAPPRAGGGGGGGGMLACAASSHPRCSPLTGLCSGCGTPAWSPHSITHARTRPHTNSAHMPTGHNSAAPQLPQLRDRISINIRIRLL